MGVPTARTDLSAIASSNSPSGSDTIAAGTGPDDYLRAHAALIRANYDDVVLKAPIASPTFTGTVTIPSPFTLDATSVTVTGAQINSLATITSGTYTPTISNVSNVASSSASAATYQRIGSVVSVSGSVLIVPTATTYTSAYLTLPVASTLSGSGLSGVGVGYTDEGGYLYVPATFSASLTDKAQVRFAGTADRGLTVFYTFTYLVK